MRLLKRESIKLGPLLSFDYVSLGLGRGQLSFELFISFLGLPRVMSVGASLYPLPFLDLLGFCVLILSSLFLQISQARLLPFMITTLASTAHVPSEGISSSLFIPPLGNLQEGCFLAILEIQSFLPTLMPIVTVKLLLPS